MSISYLIWKTSDATQETWCNLTPRDVTIDLQNSDFVIAYISVYTSPWISKTYYINAPKKSTHKKSSSDLPTTLHVVIIPVGKPMQPDVQTPEPDSFTFFFSNLLPKVCSTYTVDCVFSEPPRLLCCQ